MRLTFYSLLLFLLSYAALSFGENEAYYVGADSNNLVEYNDLPKGDYTLKIGNLSVSNEPVSDFKSFFEKNSINAVWSSVGVQLRYVVLPDSDGQYRWFDKTPLPILKAAPVLYGSQVPLNNDYLHNVLLDPRYPPKYWDKNESWSDSKDGEQLSTLTVNVTISNSKPILSEISGGVYSLSDNSLIYILNATNLRSLPTLIFEDIDITDKLYLEVGGIDSSPTIYSMISNDSKSDFNLGDFFKNVLDVDFYTKVKNLISDIYYPNLSSYRDPDFPEYGYKLEPLSFLITFGDVNPHQYNKLVLGESVSDFNLVSDKPLLESTPISYKVRFYWENSAPAISNLVLNRNITPAGLVSAVNFNFNGNDVDFVFSDYIDKVEAEIFVSSISYTTKDNQQLTWNGHQKVTVRTPTDDAFSENGNPVSIYVSVSASEIVSLLNSIVGDTAFDNVKSIDKVSFSGDSTISIYDALNAESSVLFSDIFGKDGVDADGPFLLSLVHSCAIHTIPDVVLGIPADATQHSFTITGITATRCELCETWIPLISALKFPTEFTDDSKNSISVEVSNYTDDSFSLVLDIVNETGIAEADNTELDLSLTEQCGTTAKAIQVFSLHKHSKPIIGATDQTLSGEFRRAGPIEFLVDPLISNVCHRENTCSQESLTVTATTDIGLTAVYDKSTGKLKVSGTLPDTEEFDDKDVSIILHINAVQDGTLHGSTEKDIRINFHSSEKLTHTEPTIADVSQSVTFSAGTRPQVTTIQLEMIPCELCKVSNATYQWSVVDGNYATVSGSGVICSVSFNSAPFETFSVGNYTLKARIACEHGDHIAEGTASLNLIVTQPDYPPLDFSASLDDLQSTSGAKIVIVGPTILSNFDDKTKIERDAVINGTIVTPVNTPTFWVNESNVDFGDHSVILNGAVRTGNSSADVGKPLKLIYDNSLIIPVGGDIGIIETAK